MPVHNEASGSHEGVLIQAQHAVANFGAVNRPLPFWGIRTELFGPFINHDRSREAVAALWRSRAVEAGAPAVVYVTGPRGVGKSAFCAEVGGAVRALARQIGEEDGVSGLSGDLDPEPQAGDAEPQVRYSDVFARFLTGLGVPTDEIPGGLVERRDLYHRVTGERRVVVVLEGVTRAREVIEFQPGPGSILIAAGRAEHRELYEHGVTCVTLPALDPEHGVELLRGIGAQDGRVARMVGADPVRARRIADRCGGLPLALRIVGAHLAFDRSSGLADVLSELEGAEERSGVLGARVGRVLALGYHGLGSDRARELYRSLGRCPGLRVSDGLAGALLGSAGDGSAALAELAGACLVAPDGDGNLRWEPLVREDARSRASSDGDAADRRVKGRALSWYAAAAARADRLLGGTRRRATAEWGDGAAERVPGGFVPPFGDAPADARAWAAAVADSVPGLMRWSLDVERPADGLLLAESLWPVLHELRLHAVGAGIYRSALDIARAGGDPAVVARFGNYLGRVLLDAGRFDESARELAAARAAADDSGDEICIAAVLETSALLRGSRGQWEQAIEDVSAAIAVHRGLGNTRGEAVNGYQRGLFLLGMGDTTGARTQLEHVMETAGGELALVEETERTAQASALGDAEPGGGRGSGALSGRRSDWRGLSAKTGIRLGSVLVDQGEPENAIHAGIAALEAIGEEGSPLRKADALGLMARAAHALGDLSRSMHWADQALSVFKAHHMRAQAEELRRALT